MLGDAWGTFRTIFDGVLGFGPGWVTGVALMWCVGARVTAAFRHDAEEVVRRRALVKELRAFIATALHANRHQLEILERLRIRGHGIAAFRATSVDGLGELYGIGRQTIGALRAAGVTCMGDLSARDPESVHGVGPVRGATLRAELVRQVRVIETTTEKWVAGAPSPFVRSPRIDREFDDHRARLEQRNTDLDTDLGAISHFDDEVSAFAQATEQRTQDDRVRALAAGWLNLVRAPGRLASRVVLIVVSLALLAAVPQIGRAWSHELGPMLDAVGVAIAWFGLHAWLLIHFVFSDGLRGSARVKPKPDCFAHQRLQFQVMSMAHEVGLAPPRVEILRGPNVNAFALGRPGGPSVVRIHEFLVDRLRPQELAAVIGHELGHLRGDDIRRMVSFSRLLTPLRACQHAALRLMGNVSIRVRHKVLRRGRHLILSPRLGIQTGLYGVAWLPCVALGAATSGLRLTLSCVEGLSMRVDELEADRMGGRLSGSTDHMAGALRAVDQLFEDLSVGHSTQHMESMPGDVPLDIVVPLSWRLGAWLSRVEQRLGTTHPSTNTRVLALKTELPLLWELAGALARVALIVAVTGSLLWGEVSLARNVFAWGSAQVDGFLSNDLAPAPPAVPSSSPPISEQHVRERRGCFLRTGPSKEAAEASLLRFGSVCAVLGERAGGWAAVKCGGDQGFVHTSCFKQR